MFACYSVEKRGACPPTKPKEMNSLSIRINYRKPFAYSHCPKTMTSGGNKRGNEREDTPLSPKLCVRRNSLRSTRLRRLLLCPLPNKRRRCPARLAGSPTRRYPLGNARWGPSRGIRPCRGVFASGRSGSLREFHRRCPLRPNRFRNWPKRSLLTQKRRFFQASSSDRCVR